MKIIALCLNRFLNVKTVGVATLNPEKALKGGIFRDCTTSNFAKVHLKHFITNFSNCIPYLQCHEVHESHCETLHQEQCAAVTELAEECRLEQPAPLLAHPAILPRQD